MLCFFALSFHLFINHLELFKPALVLFATRLDLYRPPIIKPDLKARLVREAQDLFRELGLVNVVAMIGNSFLIRISWFRARAQ